MSIIAIIRNTTLGHMLPTALQTAVQEAGVVVALAAAAALLLVLTQVQALGHTTTEPITLIDSINEVHSDA